MFNVVQWDNGWRCVATFVTKAEAWAWAEAQTDGRIYNVERQVSVMSRKWQ